MRRLSVRLSLVLGMLALVAVPASAERLAPPPAKAKVGQPAPTFELTDTDGKVHKLGDLRGKVVVLEWFNPGCPFVKHAHAKGVIPKLAKRWAGKGVVWLAINSGAAGKQGHGRDTNAAARMEWSMSYPVLLDESGEVGRAYGAEKTPHMYIIDKKGTLVYAGGLDNAPMGEPKGGAKLDAFVDRALAAVTAGKRVPVAETAAYGCTVKY